MHTEPHKLAGKKVNIKPFAGGADVVTGVIQGNACLVHDWFDRYAGESWMNSDTRVARTFGFRLGLSKDGLKYLDDEVVIVTVGPVPSILHVSELGDVVNASQ